MDERKRNVIIGSLLHDIGKPLQRSDRTKNHSEMGWTYLKDTIGISDEELLNQVKYHHSRALRQSNIPDNSLAYITYVADNIASGADRRANENEDEGYNLNTPLETVFNILNGNNEKMHYKPCTMDDKFGINYPEDKNVDFSQEIYSKIIYEISDCLKGIDINDDRFLNSLLEVMEADCSFIPSSTNVGEIADISLYDHCKLTAAISSCILEYLEEQEIDNYKQKLYNNEKEFNDEKSFLMYSFDISGIQSFIYTITTKNALKALRARSFYLEIMCEHLIDTLLDRLELSRANLIYSGGGHGYILMPNTVKTKTIADEIHKEINKWFMSKFKTELYIAATYVECSANDLKNTNGNYEEIFKIISKNLSQEKMNRYSYEDIFELNTVKHNGERECIVCHNTESNIENQMCSMCQKLIDMSDGIIEDKFFAIINGDSGIELPFGKSMVSCKESELRELIQYDHYVRSYSKNASYTGLGISTKLWVGDYCTDKEFEKLASKSIIKIKDEEIGVEKLGIIRGDVDNLGKAFVSGFEKKYTTLSRTATFSRKLSIFFKKHLNTLLEEKKYNAVIVYSGGDDVFIICSWRDTLGVALTLQEAFKKFTQNTLTISAGIGIYAPKYPVANMAIESGELEEKSKERPIDVEPDEPYEKNKVTLFKSNEDYEGIVDEEYTYKWDILRDKVLGEKKKCLSDYFDNNATHGKNSLYNLLNYLRTLKSNKLNLARFVYLLSRMEPDNKKDKEAQVQFDKFSKLLFEWVNNDEDRHQLIMAMYLYVYETRRKRK